jgi:protein subunit release factor B
MTVEIRDADLEIEFFRGSGPGGQHRNVTDSAVRIRHLPTGIVVTASERRSQAQNRELALERLRQTLERLQRKRKPRVATKVPKGERERRMADKRRASQVKRQRGRPEE